MTVAGTFEITRWDATDPDAPGAGPALSRVRIEKAYGGEIEGTSAGDALLCGMADPAEGAGFVVSERLSGVVGGRRGSLVLQHGGTMGAGTEAATFGHVVPGSGTGELAGASGTATLGRDADGGHTIHLDLAFDGGGG